MALADVYGMSLADEPQIEFGFLLHDAGKVAVPDAILFKPGPLTADERAVIEQLWKGLLAAGELWHELAAIERP